MELLTSSGPIIACSTNINSNTAIAIIRLSGFEDVEIFKDCFVLKEIKPRFAHFTKIVDQNKNLLDEIVLTYFKGPHSYTGENVLELSVHGNKVNVQRIINFFKKQYKFKEALPGEFSYRALKNNKLTLSQVEGLDLLINANSNFILNQGFSLLSGDLQDNYIELHKAFLNHRSAVELSIDFLDDVGEEQSEKNFNDSLKDLKAIINKLVKKVSNTENLISPEIVLFGDPNAGKSTLFNELLGDDRSIVTDIAGTTRDFITETINIDGNYFKLIDTAGIRISDDKVENEGIKRSKDKANKAFFKILLLNPNQINADLKSYLSINPDLVIITHIDNYNGDLEDFIKSIGPIEPAKSGPIEPAKSGPIEPEKSGPIEPAKSGPIEPVKSGPIEPVKSGPIEPVKSGPIEPVKSGPIEPVKCNLLTQATEITKLIQESVNNKYLLATSQNPLVLNRHKDQISKIYELVCNYSDLSEVESDISIISSELNSIGDCISELIGIVSPDDVLHNIFNNFCIGK